MIDQLRKYADLAGFDERMRWVIVIGLAIAVSILEAIGALLVYALLGLVTGAEAALELPVIGDVRDALPDLGEHTLLLWTAIAIAVFFIVRACAILGKQYVESRVTENAGARLSRRLTRGYLRMPYVFHLRRNSAELIRNAYSTVQSLIVEVFKPLVKITSESLVVLGILVVLVVTAPVATLLVILVLGPMSLVLLRLVYPRLKSLGRESQEMSRATLQSLQQSLQGVREIKLLGREEYFEREFGQARERHSRVRYLRDLVREIPAVGLETLLVVFIAGFFAVTIIVEGSAVGAIPVLGLFGYAALRLKPSLNTIVKSVNSLRFSTAGIDDVYDDIVTVERHGLQVAVGDGAPLPFEHEIHVDHVAFRYEGATSDALVDVDVRIGQGESIGIVGPTGGGKTTLVDLILGLLAPTAGSVRVDGVDIQTDPVAWQVNVGVVPQSLFLIDDTLRRNIAFGLREEEIDNARVIEVVQLAQLEDVVGSLPEGIDTLVGERGVRLSGGQRQRVAIARALYRDPKVLVFDEGTSALDRVTEGHLLAAIDALRGDRTIVTVAHRLSSVRECDSVVLVESGRVSDVGTYDDLLNRNAHFREMAL